MRRFIQWTRIEARLGSGRQVLVRLTRIERQLDELHALARAAEVTLGYVEGRAACIEQRLEPES